MANANNNSYGSTSTSSFFDGFTRLSPLPYPVLLIFAVISVFFAFHWYSSIEDAMETAEDRKNWGLLVVPVVLIIAARWLSSGDESANRFPGFYSINRVRNNNYLFPSSSDGASPWGVAAVIVLLLVLVHFQSGFLDTWFV